MGFLVISSFFPCISKHLPVGAPSADGGVHCQRPVRAGKAVQQWPEWPGAVGPRSAGSPDPRFGDVPLSHHACLRFVTYLIKCGDVVQICPDGFSCHSQCPGETSAVLLVLQFCSCQDLEQGQQNIEDIQPSAPPAPLWVPMMPEEACHLKKSSESPHAHSMSAC